ncbi:hypothetical protein FSP39_010292 [Pinctada imbricata]|uniref:C2H2-type domain-containing protein n=1 Tax=Pinctada imbricata TaxID=66713 RepID=A0AA88Y359_PINIB|nr:hypothetical protein FSP39_010292 [Pinctada imbricata]
MRPASTVEVKCHLCTEVFANMRSFKNHLAASPHLRLAVMCPWCPEERPYRRIVDLKDHTKIAHRSKLDVMPPAFFSENNGFWLSFYPADYTRVIKPSSEASEEAIKARREIPPGVWMIGRTDGNRTA